MLGLYKEVNMVYLLLDNRKLAFALVYEKPTGDIKYIEIETEEEALKYLGKVWSGEEFINALTVEEQEKLNLKSEIEYIKCLVELNNGV